MPAEICKGSERQNRGKHIAALMAGSEVREHRAYNKNQLAYISKISEEKYWRRATFELAQ